MNNGMEENNNMERNDDMTQQNQFQQQHQTPYFSQDRALPNATATLVLGILSIVVCMAGLILGIIAIVLHKKDRHLYNSNPAQYEMSYKTGRAGYICAIIGVSLSALMIVFYTLYFVFLFSVLANSGDFINA